MAPPWHLLGTIKAPCWHKKNLLLYGTFLAPILFRHMNHQSQACSCNWRYFLTGSWFWICTTVEKMLKTALRPPCKTPESVHWQPWGLEYNPAAVGRCGGQQPVFKGLWKSKNTASTRWCCKLQYIIGNGWQVKSSWSQHYRLPVEIFTRRRGPAPGRTAG